MFIDTINLIISLRKENDWKLQIFVTRNLPECVNIHNSSTNTKSI